MKTAFLFFLITLSPGISRCQTTELPYRQIPDYPEQYSASTVAARMVDGVGFRYYWATDNLRPEDLNYRPSPGARSTQETLEHLYGLSLTVVNATTQTTNTPQDLKLSYENLRKATLFNLKKASDILRNSSADDLSRFSMSSHTSSLPFWNMINGPIADCLWHIGQVVTFRRSSGNPFNSKANVLTGKLME
jgi:hypothetical protein